MAKRFLRTCQKNSEKYNKSRHDIDWESFANGETERPITIGTIIMWLKEDNLELYEKVIRDNRIITELDNITEEALADGNALGTLGTGPARKVR